MLIIIYILSLSIDTFIAALSYETDNIKIPFKSNLIISLTCSIALIISLVLSNIIKTIINVYILKWLSFFILFLIGITKIFNNNIKNILKKYKIKLITVYSDYKQADFDKSKNLSSFEAFYLALALSPDNIASGLAFNVNYNLLFFVFSFSISINIISIYITKLIRKINYNLSLLGGIIFIILAFSKIL